MEAEVKKKKSRCQLPFLPEFDQPAFLTSPEPPARGAALLIMDNSLPCQLSIKKIPQKLANGAVIQRRFLN